MTDCIFCRIGAGAVSSEILYSDDVCFVIRDIAPKAPVHLLVIPKRHVILTDLSPDDDAMIGAMYRAAREMAKREGVADAGYRLVVNQGDHAGQAVPHLHLHVLGGRRLAEMG